MEKDENQVGHLLMEPVIYGRELVNSNHRATIAPLSSHTVASSSMTAMLNQLNGQGEH
jgi:hypothetical protein